MKILLLEDDMDLGVMYATQLQESGHDVYAARDAQVALNILHEQPVELVLLDLMLPNHNGFAFLYEMRSYEDWQSTPVVILSNLTPRDLPVSESFLQNLGVKGFLVKSRVKPADVAETVATIQ